MKFYTISILRQNLRPYIEENRRNRQTRHSKRVCNRYVDIAIARRSLDGTREAQVAAVTRQANGQMVSPDGIFHPLYRSLSRNSTQKS